MTETAEDVYAVFRFVEDKKVTADMLPIVSFFSKYEGPVEMLVEFFTKNVSYLKSVPYNNTTDTLFTLLFSKNYDRGWVSREKETLLNMPEHIIGKIVKIAPDFFRTCQPLHKKRKLYQEK